MSQRLSILSSFLFLENAVVLQCLNRALFTAIVNKNKKVQRKQKMSSNWGLFKDLVLALVLMRFVSALVAVSVIACAVLVTLLAHWLFFEEKV